MDVTRDEFDRIRETFPSFARIDAQTADELYERYAQIASVAPIGAADFFRYRLFDKTDHQACDYLTHGSYALLCGRVNDPFIASGLVDKAAFYDGYRDYLGREYVVARPEEHDRFLDLCDRNRRLVYKARIRPYGSGIFMVSASEKSYLWQDALIEQAIIEERVVQHEQLAGLFPHAVNTVRMVTAVAPDGQAHLLTGTLRCGRGRYVIDGGGSLVADIDLESGAVRTAGSSRQCERYESHPDTGTTFVGFELPNWDELREKMLSVAYRNPTLRLMNWDWTCREDGTWCLFEGNFSGGIGACQEAAGRGLKSQIYQVLGLDL